jgi:hypothetical protein
VRLVPAFALNFQNIIQAFSAIHAILAMAAKVSACDRRAGGRGERVSLGPSCATPSAGAGWGHEARAPGEGRGSLDTSIYGYIRGGEATSRPGSPWRCCGRVLAKRRLRCRPAGTSSPPRRIRRSRTLGQLQEFR